MVKRVLLLLLAACSGGTTAKPRVVDDAPVATPAAAPPAAAVTPAGPYRVEAGAFAKGDAQIRVEWKDPPVEARASSGRTQCNTAKAPAVAPTTTWGIPDVIVMIDLDHGKAFGALDQARIVLSHCELAPHVLVLPPKLPLIIASASDKPERLAYSSLEPARPLGIPPPDGGPGLIARTVLLPVIGHEVAVPLEVNAITAIKAAEDVAIAVTPLQPYCAVTEANGQVVLRDVPVGTFNVMALLPARGGQDARVAKGTVTVVAGGLAEVTLTL